MEQHFLKNLDKYRNLIQNHDLKIDNVLEFGVGNGEITNILLEQGYKVFGYEIDSSLSFPTHKNLKLKICDFLQEDFSFLENLSSVGVVSNPPYSCLSFIKTIIEKYNLPFILMTNPKNLNLFHNVQIIGTFSGDDFEPVSKGKHFIIKRLSI